jgi:hypothetical protein
LLSSNDKVSCEQCDRSWGTTATGDDVKSNNGLFIRRARIVSGQIHLTYISIQPDIASAPVAGALFQLRDAYFDLSFDTKKNFV